MMDNNKHNFSPHPSPLIKFGQLNVNGLCSPVRQQHLLNFFLHSSFGALSINDTRLSPSNAKFIFKNEHSQHHFKSYWACSSSSSRPHDGVGILLRNPLHKHVQTIDSWNVILGDFNADVIAHSNYSHNHFKLLRLLSSRFFTDHQAHSTTNGPDPTFFHDNGSSRLDYICSYNFEQWNNFTTEVDDSLGVYLDKQYHSNFDFSSLSLDRMWHALKAAIISAAIETLPFRKFLD
ncbi:hypothetical protein RIR_jg880.t1 [Rhizophagus irregularis DAOM 181602=DAOM 197198]|nr:hypothetical protein RIR_jg880.t1 [Rhizophagus irregularis DAOM 181602=DAOM 197198]